MEIGTIKVEPETDLRQARALITRLLDNAEIEWQYLDCSLKNLFTR